MEAADTLLRQALGCPTVQPYNPRPIQGQKILKDTVKSNYRAWEDNLPIYPPEQTATKRGIGSSTSRYEAKGCGCPTLIVIDARVIWLILILAILAVVGYLAFKGLMTIVRATPAT